MDFVTFLPRKMCRKPSGFLKELTRCKWLHRRRISATATTLLSTSWTTFLCVFQKLQKTASLLPSSKPLKKTKNCISWALNFWQNGLPAIHRIPNHGLQFSIPLPIRHTKSPQGRTKNAKILFTIWFPKTNWFQNLHRDEKLCSRWFTRVYFLAKKYGFEKAAAVLGWSSQGANREKASI